MSPITITLALLAGLAAGFINTLAGSGSIITLTLMSFLGIPANVANATNRIGVFVQNVVGLTGYWRAGNKPAPITFWLVGPAIPGAILGAWLASVLGKQEINTVIGVVMIILFFMVLFDAERWLREHSKVREGRPSAWTLLLFFGVGFYAAFLQLGVGVMILAALVLGSGFSLKHANPVKLMIILISTTIALIVFILKPGLIDWPVGITLAVGQSVGAWLATRFAMGYKQATLWTRRLLLAVIFISILDFFGVLDMLLG